MISIVFLLYASWSDYKTREVTDRVWIAYAPIALALSLAELLLYEPSMLPLFGLSVGITVGIAFLLFYAGGFGGADSKAFMCLAVALPFFPAAVIKPLAANGLSPIAQTIFPVTILSNSVLIAALFALGFLVVNLCRLRNGKPLFEGSLAQESAGKKLLVLVTGLKYSTAELQAKWHIYPMEDIAENKTSDAALERKIVVLPKDEERDALVARLSKAADAGKIGKVWATPGLPMLIFVTVGLVLALVVGDVVWLVVGRIFG